MHPATCPHQDKAFFVHLAQATDLDQRDARGKKHALAVVLMGVIMALLAGRDGNLSAIQRHMKNHRAGGPVPDPVSAFVASSHAGYLPPPVAAPTRSCQLRSMAALVQQHYGLTLPEEFADWLSGDGKELRGSIAKPGRFLWFMQA